MAHSMSCCRLAFLMWDSSRTSAASQSVSAKSFTTAGDSDGPLSTVFSLSSSDRLSEDGDSASAKGETSRTRAIVPLLRDRLLCGLVLMRLPFWPLDFSPQNTLAAARLPEKLVLLLANPSLSGDNVAVAPSANPHGDRCHDPTIPVRTAGSALAQWFGIRGGAEEVAAGRLRAGWAPADDTRIHGRPEGSGQVSERRPEPGGDGCQGHRAVARGARTDAARRRGRPVRQRGCPLVASRSEAPRCPASG